MELNLDIPPCPEILLKFSEELDKIEPDILVIERLISGDVGLASAVMRLANSPLFGGSRSFPSISAAARYLGLGTLGSLITGVALQRALNPKGGGHLDAFWAESSRLAVELGQVVATRRYPGLRMTPSTAYTYGLFQNAGEAILRMGAPDYAEQLAARPADVSQLTWEQGTFGTDHAQLGFMLAEKWGLPVSMSLAIREHHNANAYHEGADLPRTSKELLWLGAVEGPAEAAIKEQARKRVLDLS